MSKTENNGLVCEIIIVLTEVYFWCLFSSRLLFQVSSMGITPFFVENVSELQLCAIKLVTAVSLF